MQPIDATNRPGRQRGFTLVELITTILILGILAAVAIPRYSDLQSSSRRATVNAMAGAFKSAAGLVKAKAIANGVNCLNTGGSVQLDNRSIAIHFCYPDGTGNIAAGIAGAAGAEADGTWQISVGGAWGVPGSSTTLSLASARSPGSCQVTYVSPNGPNIDPVISTTTSGC